MWYSAVSTLLLVTSVVAIWPVPTSYTNGTSVLWLSKDVEVTYNGANYVSSNKIGNSTNVDDSLSIASIVNGAIWRALETITEQSIVPWKLHTRNTLASFEPATNAPQNFIQYIEITQSSDGGTVKPLAGQVDESYGLSVTADGLVTISAVSHFGVLYGLQTLTQLFYQHSSGCGVYTNLAPVSIQDSPSFPHRGLNFDVARNWFPVEDIQRTIDAISWNKFNRLHLHMTDAQSWPLDIPALPELSAKGAYQTGLSYTPADLDAIQNFAINRGVEVIVEFDMPGHTTSIGYSYPELIAAFDAHPWDTYCAEPPCGTLKLNDPAVDAFLNTLFGDVLPRVSSYTSYFHTGGDEVNAQAYLLDSTLNSNDTSIIASYLQKFVDRNHDQVRSAGLTPIVWEEMLLQWNLTLGSDVLVQAWQTDEAVASITAKGHKAIAGNYNFWYLDCGKGQWLDFSPASYNQYYPFLDYCSPVKNWRLIYSYDPLQGVPANSTSLVLGADVHIWSEQTDPVNLDDMVWPRASAAGEVLWSGAKDANGQNRSQIEASPRLAEMRERMVQRGVRAGPVQMVFCTQSDPTECSL